MGNFYEGCSASDVCREILQSKNLSSDDWAVHLFPVSLSSECTSELLTNDAPLPPVMNAILTSRRIPPPPAPQPGFEDIFDNIAGVWTRRRRRYSQGTEARFGELSSTLPRG